MSLSKTIIIYVCMNEEFKEYFHQSHLLASIELKSFLHLKSL